MGHGTTRQDQTAKTWVGRDVQSIIIILEADMVHVCAGIHFYYGTCSRWRDWYKPRYRHFTVACSLTSTN